MKLVCIDGSLQNLGIAVLSVNSKFEVTGLNQLLLNTTKPSDNKKIRKSYDDLARFQSHWNALTTVIDKWKPDWTVGEVPSGSQDSRAMFAFGGVTAMYACLPVQFMPVTALEVKEAATGFKHADKEDMIEWAYGKFPSAGWLTSKRSNKMNIKDSKGLYLKNENEHLADAIGVGFAGLKYISKLSVKD